MRQTLLSGLATLTLLSAACAPAPAAPTPAPAKPTAAPAAPTAAPAAAAKPTTAPAAPAAAPKPTEAAKPAEAPKPTAAAAAKPAAAAASTVPLRVAIPAGFTSLDPAFDNAGLTQNVLRNLFDTLVERDVNYEMKGVLAESWRVVEPTVWEFKIRGGVKFHSGDDLTAEDVAYTYQRLLNKDLNAPMASYVGQVDSATATDATTVRVVTKAPYAPLLIALSSIAIVPKKVVEAVGRDAFAQKPIGSGPYRFVEYVKDDHLTLTASPDYWGGAPKIGQVTFRPIPEASTRAAALMTGQVDLVQDIPEQMMREVDARQDVKTTSLPSARTHQLLIDSTVAPFTDVRVRQAVMYAIDYDSIIKNITGGLAQRVCQPVSPDSWGYDPNYACPTFDLARSQRLLAEAGLPNGFDVELGGAAGARPYDKETQEAITAMLGKANIRVKLSLLESGRWVQGYTTREWPMTYHTNAGPGDAEYVFGFGFYSQTSRGYWKDPENTDPLIDASRAEFDPAKRRTILQDIMRQLTEQAAWVVLFVQPDIWGAKRTLAWQPLSDQRLDMNRASWTN